MPDNNSTPANEPAVDIKQPDAGNSTLMNPAADKEPDDKAAPQASATDDKQPDAAANAPAVPDKYELKVPEGQEMDTEALNEFTPLAKDLKLSNDQAQKLVDLYAKRALAIESRQKEAYSRQVESWIAEVKADKEIGGDKLAGVQASCRRALNAYDPDNAFMKLMDDTGLGNHPAVLKFVNRVGASVKEDTAVAGKKPAVERDINEILYNKRS